MPGRPRRGFTLIELLVALAIIGLLLSIAVPRYLGSLDHAREVALRENLGVMREVIDKFHSDKGRYPESLEELVSAKYLKAIPIDPITESATTWIAVVSSNPAEKGIADVRSGAPNATASGVPYGQI